MVAGCDEMVTSGLLRNGLQDLIERKKGIAGKVHLRHEPLRELVPKVGEVDVGQPLGDPVILPGVWA
jgi:hypothetical protein